LKNLWPLQQYVAVLCYVYPPHVHQQFLLGIRAGKIYSYRNEADMAEDGLWAQTKSTAASNPRITFYAISRRDICTVVVTSRFAASSRISFIGAFSLARIFCVDTDFSFRRNLEIRSGAELWCSSHYSFAFYTKHFASSWNPNGSDTRISWFLDFVYLQELLITTKHRCSEIGSFSVIRLGEVDA
jgi:hypothetical protein